MDQGQEVSVEGSGPVFRRESIQAATQAVAMG